MTISASQLRLHNNLEADGSGALRIAAAMAAFGLSRTGSFGLQVDTASLNGAGIDLDGDNKFRIAASAAGVGLQGGGGSALAVDQSAAFVFTGFQGTLNGDLAAGGNRVTGLANPSSNSDAATKLYVDGVAQGLRVKDTVQAATDAALPGYTHAASVLTATGNGALTVDGDAVQINQRVLVKDETGLNQKYNGWYELTQLGDVANPWKLTRAADADIAVELAEGSFCWVRSGTKNGNTRWAVSTEPGVLNTDPVAFSQISGAAEVTAGAGLTKTGNSLDLVAADASLNVGADNVAVRRDTNGAIGLSGGGLVVQVVADSMQIQSNNLGIKLDANGGLQAVNGGSGVSIKAGPSSPFALSSAGLDLSLATNPGLVIAANKLAAQGNAAKGITIGASGIEGKVDGSSIVFDGQGNVSIAASGVGTSKLADSAVTPAKLSVTRTREDYPDSGWTYGSSINSRNVAATPSTAAQVIQDQVFMRNGVETGFKRVSGTPANEGEWRLNGTTLEVFSAADFGGSGDNFTVKYHA